MNKVLIFGGAGFIGTHAAISALAQGAQVILFDNLSRQGSHMNQTWLQEQYGDRVTLIKEDIRSADAIRTFLSAHGDADAILHLAGQVAVTTSLANPEMDFEINLRGTLNILEAMRGENLACPLLYASTNKVYGALESLAIAEKDDHYELADFPEGISESQPLDFHSPYACSKGGADQYVIDYARIYGLKTIVFRQSCIYGTHQFGVEDQGWVAWFTIARMLGQPITIYGNGKQVRDILFADDLVTAFWAALTAIDKTCGQAYNIGGGANRLSLLQLLALLDQKLGKTADVTNQATRSGDQLIFVSDNRKAKQDFDWSPTIDPETGVKKLIDWINENQDTVRSCLGL